MTRLVVPLFGVIFRLRGSFPLTPKTRLLVMKLSLFKSSNGHHMEFWQPHREVAILVGLNMEEADGL